MTTPNPSRERSPGVCQRLWLAVEARVGCAWCWVSKRFMKNRTSLVIVALLASMFVGCSKHSSPPPKVADLGVVEVTNGGTNRVTSEDGRIFVVRSLIVKDPKVRDTADGKEIILKGPKILLMISQEQTDSHGLTHLSPEQGIGATPGQTVGVSDGVVSIRITPKIKI